MSGSTNCSKDRNNMTSSCLQMQLMVQSEIITDLMATHTNFPDKEKHSSRRA